MKEPARQSSRPAKSCKSESRMDLFKNNVGKTDRIIRVILGCS